MTTYALYSVPKWKYDYCTGIKKLRLILFAFGLTLLHVRSNQVACTVINSITVHGNFAANWTLKLKLQPIKLENTHVPAVKEIVQRNINLG